MEKSEKTSKPRKNRGSKDKESKSQECNIEEYFDAARWAAFVLDLEAVVSEFNSVLFWDYKSFLVIAERKNIIQLHRCAYYPSQLLGNDRKLNTIAFERLERLLFNTAKDIWLETVVPINESEKLINFKRNVTGLYLLYFLWTTQGQSDNYKILISFTAIDQNRLGVFNERLERLHFRIPDWNRVGKCIVYIIESFRARHAFQFTFRNDEARLDREYLQLIRAKNFSDVRPTLLSIHATQHYKSLLIWVEGLCQKMSRILCEAEKAAQVPVAMSLLLRNFVPLNVIQNCMLFEPENFKPLMLKLPGNYIPVAEQIIQLAYKNFTMIQRPFLTMDALVQLDHVTTKIQSFGKSRAQAREQRYATNQKQLKDNVKTFNEKCIAANRYDKVIPESPRPYREMDSYAWDFIHERLGSDANKLHQQKPKIGCVLSGNSLVEVLPSIQSTSELGTVSTTEELTTIPEVSSKSDVSGDSGTSFNNLMELDEDEKRIQSLIHNLAPSVAMESTSVLKQLI